LGDLAEIPASVDLPSELSIEARGEKLVGVAYEGCVSLVAIAPTRFAVPENPGLEIAFHLDSEAHMTLEGRGMAIVYRPTR
jgi:hypothetical protein